MYYCTTRVINLSRKSPPAFAGLNINRATWCSKKKYIGSALSAGGPGVRKWKTYSTNISREREVVVHSPRSRRRRKHKNSPDLDSVVGKPLNR